MPIGSRTASRRSICSEVRRSSSISAPRRTSTSSRLPVSTWAVRSRSVSRCRWTPSSNALPRCRRIQLVAPTVAIGRSTVASMQIGAIFGHAGLVDGICARILAELGEATVIGTGGLVEVVAPHTKYVHEIEPWLTLHGLRVLYWRNTDEKSRR